MDTFDYAAIDAKGQRLTGSIAAANAREARDMLRAQSLTPVNVQTSRSKRTSLFNRTPKPSPRDVTQATRQLAILIDAATPIEEALRVTALQFEKSAMRAVLLDTRKRVMEGARLSDALRAHPAVFSDLYTAMIASGETSGRLPLVLERLASDLEANRKIRQKIMAATAYPMVLSFVALAVVVILMVFVVPRVVDQFQTFEQDLPMLTIFVISVSNGLKSYGLIAAIVIVACIFGFTQALKRPAFKYRWHKFILALPLLGTISQNLNAARFSRTMSGLIDSGTPSLTAMETAQHTLQNVVMRDAVKTAAGRVLEGSAMSVALKQTGLFPALVTQMISGGETSGHVGTMFGKAADYLEGEFESMTAVFLNLLEPLIIIIMSLIVLVIIGAIFMPILQLNTLAF